MGADTKANWGGGALELDDLRLLEDGSERGGALVADAVALDAAKHGGGWGGERRGVSMGADTKANTMGWGALERGHGAPLERLAQLGHGLHSVSALTREWAHATEPVVLQAAKERRRGEECQWALTQRQTLCGR